MRQQQVASPERASLGASKKGCVKNGRREEAVGDEKRLQDCVKVGDRRVLVKMPGNRLKLTSSSQQGKLNNDRSQKVTEVNQISVNEQEETGEQGQKRSRSDGVSLLQWGQRKRLRFNNKVEAKAVAEHTEADMKAILRPERRVARSEKLLRVPAARSKAPAVASNSPSVPKLATKDSKRDAEETETTGTARNRNNHVNGGLESEVNTARLSEMHAQQPIVNPDKASSSLEALPAVSARTEENAHQEKTAVLEKVDMDLFQWPKFLVSLSRKEKEDDFFAIKGSKLPIRPKKRSKHVERTLRYVSPGAWLCDLTRERYEVREKKAIKKRPRGLKAMGSADSDTE